MPFLLSHKTLGEVNYVLETPKGALETLNDTLGSPKEILGEVTINLGTLKGVLGTPTDALGSPKDILGKLTIALGTPKGVLGEFICALELQPICWGKQLECWGFHQNLIN